MPRIAEVNPVAQGLPVAAGWAAKVALVALVVGIQPLLRPKYALVGDIVALFAIFVGALGAGSNLAVGPMEVT